MKHTIISLGLLISIGLISCGEEPTTHNREATGYFNNSPSTNVPSGTVYCTISGDNCWEWIGEGDQVVLNAPNTAYNNFLSDYSSNNLSNFFQSNNWLYLFPDDCPVSQDDIDKVANGQFATRVMSDSSIVIFNNNKVLDFGNILYVIKRQ